MGRTSGTRAALALTGKTSSSVTGAAGAATAGSADRGRPYGKREAQAWRRAVYPELLEELQAKVARVLRLAGR